MLFLSSIKFYSCFVFRWTQPVSCLCLPVLWTDTLSGEFVRWARHHRGSFREPFNLSKHKSNAVPELNKALGYGDLWVVDVFTQAFLTRNSSWRWVISFKSRPLYPRGKSPIHLLGRRLGGRHRQVNILKCTWTRTASLRNAMSMHHICHGGSFSGGQRYWQAVCIRDEVLITIWNLRRQLQCCVCSEYLYLALDREHFCRVLNEELQDCFCNLQYAC
jgi:hypothetical protein